LTRLEEQVRDLLDNVGLKIRELGSGPPHQRQNDDEEKQPLIDDVLDPIRLELKEVRDPLREVWDHKTGEKHCQDD
jgi:hypothetical protein